MRTGASDVSSRGFRGQVRPDARLKNTRKTRLHRAFLDTEFLEPRTLLAVIPAATPSGTIAAIGIGTSNVANTSSPVVAIDPLDPSKLAAVWVNNDTKLTTPGAVVTVGGAYSIDGGANWSNFTASDRFVTDPAASSATTFVSYAQITDPSIAFDRSGNLYVLASYHNAGNTSGALILEKFNFTGSSPGSTLSDNIVYQWTGSDPANTPALAVDSNLASFTDPVTQNVQSDPYAAGAPNHPNANIYVAWASSDTKPSLESATGYNPNRIQLVVSSDGGSTFAGPVAQNAGGNAGDQRNSHPQLVISGTGQLAVGWSDFGTFSTATVPFSSLQSSATNPGSASTFQDPNLPAAIPPGTSTASTTTTFSYPITVNNSAAINNLTVTLALYHPNDSNLSIVLQGPDGSKITLFGVKALSGANLGIQGASNTFPGFVIGTTFDDNATRNIFDPTAGGTNGNTNPYIGHFQAEGGSLDNFIAKVRSNNAGTLSGTWSLIITDTAAETPPGSLVEFNLQFNSGLTSKGQATIASEFGDANGNDTIVTLGALGDNFPRASAASPTGIGPGLVMAEDTTLGSFSPYQGRIYAAFVAYKNTKVLGVQNPTDNTDIYTVYSDNGGLSWSSPIQLNDDAGVIDGTSGANNNPAQGIVTGRVQFQPEIAVDQATGTVVYSWRDGRDDVARSRVATYITASIDGGNTFNQQVYANPPKTTVDAITGNTVVVGPQSDNESSGNPQRDGTFGYGDQMGLAVFDGHVYPVWSGNLNQGAISNGAVVAAHPLYIYYQPMVIAAGPRVVNSTMGPVTGVSKPTSFEIDFDRPIDPNLVRNDPSFGPSFTPANVQVEYHDTTNGSAFKSLYVTSVTPVVTNATDPTQNGVYGYTTFTVTFNPDLLADGVTPSGIKNYTGTYSYIIAPDNHGAGGQFNTINSPIRSLVSFPVPQPPVTVSSGSNLNLPIPDVTNNDVTESNIIVSGQPTNAKVSNITVTINLTYPSDGDLEIALVRFDLSTLQYSFIYFKPGDTNQNFTNVTFSDSASQSINTAPGPYTNGTYQPSNPLSALSGVPLNGDYTLYVYDFNAGNGNVGTINSWSMTINSVTYGTKIQDGAAMDQNADATPDQNPLTTPFTGLTPGDLYVAPMPAPSSPFTFNANNILTPPFNQNTLPLIMPGPYVTSTSVPTGTGNDDLVLNGTVSTMNVTFNRPMQVSSFTPSDVLQIMGPAGSISGPQYFPAPSTSVNQPIPTAITTPEIGRAHV